MTVALLSVLIFITCTNMVEPDHNARQVVRDYIESKGYEIEEELSWGEVDSVFSAFNLDLSFDYFMEKYKNEQSYYLYDMSFYRRNSKEYQNAKDSIEILNQLMHELNKDYIDKILEGKPNRLGIHFSFNSSEGETEDYIYVFNADGKSIGHVVNERGTVINFGNRIAKRYGVQN